MAKTDRLIRRKVRLTHRLVRADNRRYKHGRPVREKLLLRARLYRIDLLLERAGEFPGHTWYPYARRDPGLNAGYRRGRSLMRQMRVHYTVGTASGALIRNKGLAQFLIDRDGTVNEYAEADSVCGDACEWNPLGFGVEVEALDRGQFTPQQIKSLAGLWSWAHATYGIPDTWHLGPDYGDGPRAPVGSDARGVYNHDALDERKCDRHFDGATPAERDAIRGTTSSVAPPTRKAHDMVVLLPPYQNTVLAYVVVGNKMLRQLNSEPRGAYGIPQAAIDFANAHSCPILTVTQEEWNRVVTDDANIVKRLAAWIAKLFPAKAARAGEV